MDKRVLSLDSSRLRGALRLGEPMSKHTSWRVGGLADSVYFPADIDDLGVFLEELESDCPLIFTGLGSNVLIRDSGLRGVVVITNPALNSLSVVDTKDGVVPSIYAEAGVPSPKLAKFSVTQELEGLEFLAGVPGTIGGALAMNAGCFGKETWQAISKVKTVNRNGQFLVRRPSEYKIGYRSAELISQECEFFVAAWFKADLGSKENGKSRIKQLLKRRSETQPTQQPNAGSVFKNPPDDYAARLIEKSGLKGFSMGGASVSNKHANFFINDGRATAQDFELLIDHVKSVVYKMSGVSLEQEVVIIGEK